MHLQTQNGRISDARNRVTSKLAGFIQVFPSRVRRVQSAGTSIFRQPNTQLHGYSSLYGSPNP